MINGSTHRGHNSNILADLAEFTLKKKKVSYKKVYKPTRFIRFMMQKSCINPTLYTDGVYSNIEQKSKNVFIFEVSYFGEHLTKKLLIDKLTKVFKKLDNKIEVNEIK